jgi:ubiquinone/menaquinone biosynthesis C-methylase UbiE
MSIMEKLFPWTMMFGKRDNFEGGYFAEEGELVEKYAHHPDDVLIFGSGNGREARPLVHRAKRIVCFDYGLGYVLAGKKLCDAEGIRNVEFVLADALHLPFPPASFDFIFCSIYSALKDNRRRVMHDVRQILRKEAYVLITCYLPWASKAIKYEFATCNNIKELEEEISQCGFSLVEGRQDQVHNKYLFAIFSPE